LMRGGREFWEHSKMLEQPLDLSSDACFLPFSESIDVI
jgi:hypothetical protein